jgi:hypothetical protein
MANARQQFLDHDDALSDYTFSARRITMTFKIKQDRLGTPIHSRLQITEAVDRRAATCPGVNAGRVTTSKPRLDL